MLICVICQKLNKKKKPYKPNTQKEHVLPYRSGSVFTPITGLSLSKTLLAARSIVPSPKGNKHKTTRLMLQNNF